jgi:Succinylglutamate desuccinylase / Aspartoacylase family
MNELLKDRKNLLASAGVLAAAAAILAVVIPDALSMRQPDVIHKGPGVTEVRKLSDFFDGIAGTKGDTEVYVLDSGKPGANALILGGTHANEPAGYLTAVLFVENAVPAAGKLYVIPTANASAMTHTDYMEGTPRKFSIDTPAGSRSFRFGSRATSPADQWPDPDIYVHASSGQRLSGSETRNLNRAFPGRADGTFTEKVAFAITSLIRKEKIQITIDLHEASPEYPVVNAIVAHDRAMKIASIALLNLEMDDIAIGVEPSPTNLRGLSHRELGDATETLALLFESTNPSQGRLRGVTNEALIVEGKDDMYLAAHKLGRLFVPFGPEGEPLKKRVARHVSATQAVFEAYGSEMPERPLVVGAMPSYKDLLGNGIGQYLKAPRTALSR